MPRYYFDVYDGAITVDDEGHDLADWNAARTLAMKSLPRIAADEIPEDGDKQNYVVIVRNEDGNAVYSAIMSYVGLKLPGPASCH